MSADAEARRRRKLADLAAGHRGEDLALQLAVARGWQPWLRQVRVGRTEIDLALLRDDPQGRHLLLVEVKTTRGAGVDHALRWGAAQQQRLWRAAEPLMEQANAGDVSAALVLVRLASDHHTVTWLDAPAELGF
ncbi:MAG: YraN family protein [Deltaproteobacteria bacterium]|nr:YraN family protein [Deltaproteobacteria bacterium]